MKKAIILIVACAATALSLNAQTVVRISVGAVPGLMSSVSKDFVLNRPQTLYGIYGELYVLESCSPVYQVEVSRQLRERILVGLSLATANGVGYNRGSNDVNILNKKKVNDYALMAHARYYYYNGGDYYLYGGAALGIGYQHTQITNKKTELAGGQTKDRIFAEYELSPIGINIGSGRFGFFVEGVVGSLVNGARLGVKYRF